LKEAELIQNRVGLLGAVDPYTGRYFSQAWIQRNILRMNDDEIKKIQEEIDEEKAEGIGLPVALSNAAAQQQMVGDVEQEQQQDQAEHQAKLDAQNDDGQKNESKTFSKLKRIL
jgi:hypothetical protein